MRVNSDGGARRATTVSDGVWRDTWRGRPNALTPEQAEEVRRIVAQRRALPTRAELSEQLGLSPHQLDGALYGARGKRLGRDVLKTLSEHRRARMRLPTLVALAVRYGVSLSALKWYANSLHKRPPGALGQPVRP